jgi:hypothetical protein
MNAKNAKKARVKEKENDESEVLLKLLKASVSLLEENSDEISGRKVYLAWKKFLLEVLSFLVYKSSEIISENSKNKESILNSKAKLYTVGSTSQASRSIYGQNRLVPQIRMSGSWLENCGFCIGKRFEIYPEKNHLILKEASFVEDLIEGPEDTEEAEGEMSNG